MNRLIPVLAMALILVLLSRDEASSRRYPELRLETVQWDHPWGGEHQNLTNPPIMTVTPSPSDELQFIDIMKFWYRSVSSSLIYRYDRFITHLKPGATEVIPDSQPDTEPETEQVTTQGGSGL
jgi:hypothetical protein